jgi:alkaline phosphatase/alkaline phosphatase D
MLEKFGFLLLSFLFSITNTHAQLSHGQGEMAGEVTENSVILQSRLTKGTKLINGDLPGHEGWAQFEIAPSEDFKRAKTTGWHEAFSDDDYIIKAQVGFLEADTQYFYRLVFGPDMKNVTRGKTRSFRTLPDTSVAKPFRFVIVSEMNYHPFHKGERAYQGADKNLGYPALEAIKNLNPNLFIGAGNTVYYDDPIKPAVRTRNQMRKKWHQQFSQPRFSLLFGQVAT